MSWEQRTCCRIPPKNALDNLLAKCIQAQEEGRNDDVDQDERLIGRPAHPKPTPTPVAAPQETLVVVPTKRKDPNEHHTTNRKKRPPPAKVLCSVIKENGTQKNSDRHTASGPSSNQPRLCKGNSAQIWLRYTY
ncbi:hypothetical protein MJO28_013940 [Puccinia striiformis f. sp. tritici]|uniref:Uncharacterized protein n=1 Tax=Puccinia striiformis f. sp. tritici TaxID=168172 RepID=A0ACC0DX91_9BASI|nr:hypothetical protein MJO28_013940 [Puccinia striiformis f. sp. tritici]